MAKKQHKVLVVDDIEKNLQLVGSLLTDRGISILFAKNGKQAIAAVKKARPDLILLDIAMPEMDGFEVCEQLKSDNKFKEIPIIFLTAKNEADDIIKGFAYGAVDYITKPFNKDELISRVLTHLELKNSRDIISHQNSQLETQNQKILDHAKQVEILNKDLVKTNAELKELNATKDKFFSIISHDLKNPMSNILNLTELIYSRLDNYSPEKLKEIMTILLDSAEKSNKLLVNLLDWAMAQSGRILYSPKKLNVALLIRDAITNASPIASNKSITVDYTCDEDLLAKADLDMTTALLRNLISNAIKYTPKKGKIKISAKLLVAKEPHQIEISVKDNGIGMKKEVLESLFKIETTHSESGTEGETGTGLGLLLCKEYAEKNKGEIYAKSKPGKGSAFSFTLPSK